MLSGVSLNARARQPERAARADAVGQDNNPATDGGSRRASRRQSVWSTDRDVTGTPVRQRSVAMVYQQFINYPNLTVFENIASPLRVAGCRDELDRRVREPRL